ncbi:hypothetical protein KKC32_05125 [Patescibacteria group bacterium]|nr:hypothetical protein [Patescibacteria group bacterium]
MFLLISTENTTHFSVAAGNEAIEKIKIVKKQYKHSELLLKTINELGHEKWQAIFVVAGSGAFSALRIGIATANAFSFALKIPVVGVKIEKDWNYSDEKEKMEKVWSAAVAELKRKKKKADFVIPFYDKEPNIT